MVLFPLTEAKILKLFNKLNNESSPGSDGLHSDILQKCKFHILDPITNLINCCFQSVIGGRIDIEAT